jgi:hypothetical protein
MNITELRKENVVKGWTEVPVSCPSRFVDKICEKRSLALATGHSIPAPAFRHMPGRTAAYFSATVNRPSLEDCFRSMTGKEPRHAQSLAARVELLGIQVRTDAIKMAAEKEISERNAMVVNAALFPWTVS